MTTTSAAEEDETGAKAMAHKATAATTGWGIRDFIMP
jgi:hypothetical protein